MLKKLLFPILIAIVNLNAENLVTITPVTDLPGAVYIIPEQPIDGVKSFVVMRPYVDEQTYIIHTPTKWALAAAYLGGAALISYIAYKCKAYSEEKFRVLLSENGKDAKHIMYGGFFNDYDWSNKSARKCAQTLYYFNNLTIDSRIMSPISIFYILGGAGVIYFTYKALQTCIAAYMQRQKASLGAQQILALPIWLRNAAQDHFKCAPEHLVWYIAEALPPLTRRG